MRLSDSIRALRDAGLQFRVRGSEVRYRAPRGFLSPELRHRLSGWKHEIAALLPEEAREGWTLLPSTFPCRACGRFAFGEPGVVCYWCREGR